MLRMAHPRRAIVLIVLTLLAAVGFATPAWADGYGGTTCAQQPDTASCTATAGTTGTRGKSAASKHACRNADGAVVPCSIAGKGWYSSTDGCYYRAASTSEQPGPAAPGKRWFYGTCGDPSTGFARDVAILTQFRTAPGPETVAQQAVAMLRLPSPTIRMSPSSSAVQVVRVPSWLWVAGSVWRARAATASIGGVTVTARARPTSASWSTGDGTTLTCDGPGTAWHPTADPASPSPTCGHTYLSPSTGSGYRVTATITWTVTWAGAGMTGAAGPLTSTAATQVRVVQSSAVNVAGEGGGQ